jgi:hypothetical protein
MPIEDFYNKRAELCSFETNETPAERRYYDDMGRINFLENSPLTRKRMDVTNEIPIALIEGENRVYRTIFANKAFYQEIISFGANDINDVLSLLTPESALYCFKRLVYSEEYNETVEYNLILNNSVVKTKVRFLSRMGTKAVYAFMAKNISAHEKK